MPTTYNKIDQFFLQHPSQYAYLTYRYFDEALATALGNGVFVEALYGQHDINYTNKFIRGLAMAIYGDVEKYLNKQQEMDTAFLVKCVKRFKEHFPDASRNLQQILDRYVLFTHDLDREQVQQRLVYHFHPSSVFLHPLKEPNIDEYAPYYDRNSPCIFVLSPREKDSLATLCEVNPYLQRVKKSKLKKLNDGFDYYRDKHGRLYLFFVAAYYDELEQLIKTHGGFSELRPRGLSILPRNDAELQEIFEELKRVCDQTNAEMASEYVFVEVKKERLEIRNSGYTKYWKSIDLTFTPLVNASASYFDVIEEIYQAFLKNLSNSVTM